MNLILFEDSDLINENTVRFQHDRFLHIKTVHQATAGDTVRLGKLNGLMGTGKVQTITEQTVDITFTLHQPPPAKLPLTLVLALPRPKMIRRIFRSVAELGVQKLLLINSYRVEKSYWRSPALSEAHIKRYLIEGLQQACDTVLPAVELKTLFKPFVEDELPTIIGSSEGLVAHPGQGSNCPHQINRAVTLAIGPEGGFIPYEVEKLIEAGCKPIHLGERILKVENAVTALVSKLYS